MPVRGDRARRCQRGHRLTGENVRAEGTRRRCVICRRASARQAAAARRQRRGAGLAPSARTQCPRGHPLTGPGANVYVYTDRHGWRHRRCRPCHVVAVAASGRTRTVAPRLAAILAGARVPPEWRALRLWADCFDRGAASPPTTRRALGLARRLGFALADGRVILPPSVTPSR